MEPNKLENQFREKLNNREINPSEAAWDRLDAMLSVADPNNSGQAKQKPKRKFTWLYVAASFIGFFLISTVFFNQKENTIDTKNNNVVIENKTPKDRSKTESKSIKNEVDYSKAILKQETKPLVQTEKKAESNVKNQTIKSQQEVVAEIQPVKLNEPTVINLNAIPSDIDSLLASTSKPNLDTNKKSIKINSTNLLNQVDGELQLSFREKALNTITKKYKEAKEALVNRNNQ
jgi:hypothetical protein